MLKAYGLLGPRLRTLLTRANLAHVDDVHTGSLVEGPQLGKRRRHGAHRAVAHETWILHAAAKAREVDADS
jgi:hypothetical protein